VKTRPPYHEKVEEEIEIHHSTHEPHHGQGMKISGRNKSKTKEKKALDNFIKEL
jgi:hypothetical protein